MTPDRDDPTHLRRYVLGALPDEESAALEEQYFVDPDVLDRVSVAEDELIEDYLGQRLAPEELDRFERHYLSTPGHRARVAVMRGLMATASRADVASALRELPGAEPQSAQQAGARTGLAPATRDTPGSEGSEGLGPASRSGATTEPFAPERPGTHRGRTLSRWRSRLGRSEPETGGWSLFQQAALAATLALILGASAIWLFTSRQDGPQDASTQATNRTPATQPPAPGQPPLQPQPQPQQQPTTPSPGVPPASPASPGTPGTPATPAVPIIVALSLSPVNVRGAGIDPSVTVPAEAETLLLRLEGEAGAPPLRRGRAVLRTVSGDEVWRGPVEPPRDARPGLLALVRLPAHRLRTDDCIVELYGTDGDGRESERARYFVRIRVADRR